MRNKLYLFITSLLYNLQDMQFIHSIYKDNYSVQSSHLLEAKKNLYCPKTKTTREREIVGKRQRERLIGGLEIYSQPPEESINHCNVRRTVLAWLVNVGSRCGRLFVIRTGQRSLQKNRNGRN